MAQVTIQIVKKYYSKIEATKAASFFRSEAKKDNRPVTIEILNAYQFYTSSSYLKNKTTLGIPKMNQFIIIIKNIKPVRKVSTKNKTNTTSMIIKMPPTLKPKKVNPIILPFGIPRYSQATLQSKKHFTTILKMQPSRIVTNTIPFPRQGLYPAA